MHKMVFQLALLMGLTGCSLIPSSALSMIDPHKAYFTTTSNSPRNAAAQNFPLQATSSEKAVNPQSLFAADDVYLPLVFKGFPPIAAFNFISWSDAQDGGYHLPTTSNQAVILNPAFTIFNGDLEEDGFVKSQMDVEVTALNGGAGKYNGIYNKTFLVRGNHDDETSGSAGLWENYFSLANRPLPPGVTNYTPLNSSLTYLTYSFDYGNSRFIGVDVPGDAELLTSAQATFIDGRLTDAESKGLTHAFLFFHGPEYCVESTHCNCSAAKDAKCTPVSIINLINKHPIVSATFHGHEHILGWVHMSSARVSSLTHAYEEFLTSPSGSSTYNDYLYPNRVDYAEIKDDTQAFASISVNGRSFTVSLYRVGNSSPVWVKSFTK